MFIGILFLFKSFLRGVEAPVPGCALFIALCVCLKSVNLKSVSEKSRWSNGKVFASLAGGRPIGPRHRHFLFSGVFIGIISFIQDSADEHIPSKTSRPVSSVPWITPVIRNIRKKKMKTHANLKAKKTGSKKLRYKFETLRRETKVSYRYRTIRKKFQSFIIVTMVW